MTIDEAKYALKLMFCHDCPYSHSGDCSGKECKQAMDVCIKALDNAERYRWHDLRKNRRICQQQKPRSMLYAKETEEKSEHTE